MARKLPKDAEAEPRTQLAIRLEAALAGRPGLTARALSLKAGLNGGHVEQITSGRLRSPQAGTVAAIAQALEMSYADLMPDAPVRTVEREPRYANLESAIGMLSRSLLPDTIATARTIAMKRVDDMTEGEWVDELRQLDRVLRGIAGVPGRLLADEDDTPPAGR